MRFISILTILLMAMAPIANAGPPSPPGQPAGTTLQTNSGTTLPATCTTGQMFLDTDADTNGSLYICVATDTWKLDDDDGGAGGGTMTTVEEGDVQVGGADIVTIDCGAGLDCTESPDTEINIVVDLSETGLGSTHDTSGELDALYESATSNDFDPDRIAGDTSDDNLIDEGIIDADIMRDSEAAAAYQPLEATLTDIADGTIAENLVNTANPWAVNEGGTGSGTASGARTNLGLVIGTNVLAPDGVGTNLTALNGENVQDDTIDDDSIDFGDVTSSDLTFDADSVINTAVYSGTTSLEETTAADDSGAYIIGVYDEFDNSNSTNVQDVLDDLDAAISGSGLPTTGGTMTGNITMDDGSGASPDIIFTDETNETATFEKADSGFLGLTTQAADGLNILVGNLKVGNGTPTNALDGEDLYVEGDVEVDGNIVAAGDLTVTGDDLFMATNTDGYMLIADGTNFNPVAISGDISITNAGVVSLSANSVAAAELADSDWGDVAISSNSAEVQALTVSDSGDADATWYLIIADGATGTQVMQTDGEFYFNPSTNVLYSAGGFDSADADDATYSHDPSTAGESLWYTGPNHDSVGDDNDPYEIRQNSTPGSSVRSSLSVDGVLSVLGGIDAIGAVDIDYGSADVTDHTFITDGTGDGEIVLPNDSIGPAEIDSTTGVYDFGSVTSFELPNAAGPTVDAAGESAIDTTSDQFVYYGGAKRVLHYTRHECVVVENLAAADDNYEIWMANDAVTITGIGVHCRGTCTTGADISLEDRSGNAMTHTTPTHSTGTGNTTFQSVTAANTLVAGEGLAFDVDNAVSPETDEYTICFTYEITAD